MFIIFKVPDMDMRELKIAGVAVTFVTRDKKIKKYTYISHVFSGATYFSGSLL